MRRQSQDEVCRFLLDPTTHGVGASEIERVDTHIAIVVLAGAHAYKLKRAVRLPFVDFTSLESREAACRNEVLVNRRTAPDIYLGIKAITRETDGRLVFDGQGRVLDWVVGMRRFDQSQLLDRLAQRGALTGQIALRLAETIAAFHGDAELTPDGAGASEMRRIIGVNGDRLRAYAGAVFDLESIEDVTRASEHWLGNCEDVLDRRRQAGQVRHCHGDLHLRNIFLDAGHPVIFDAIEFDDRLARTDVMYDLAFLLMDLWHRGWPDLANLVLNRYLLLTGDDDGLAPLPLFLSLRAAIRAHVSATMAETNGGADKKSDDLNEEARHYLALAQDLLRPTGPVLIAVGGFSGSGKSTLAQGLAPRFPPVPGALVLRSDEVRKRLMNAAPETSLDAAAYAPAVSRRVYDALRRRAGDILRAGYSVVVDAVHDRDDARRDIAAVAEVAGVPFQGFWLQASERTMARRIEGRGLDASDATAEVMRRQIAQASVPRDWHVLDGERDAAPTLAQACEQLIAAGILDARV